MQITKTAHQTYSPELNAELVERFQNEGYIALENVLTPEEVTQSKATLTELFQRVVDKDTGLKEGKFWTSSESPSPHKFAVQYEPGYKFDPNASVEELELKVRKLMWFTDQHPFFEY